MKSSPKLLDGKGRPLVLPLMRPGTQRDSAESDGRAKDAKTRILELLLASPQPSAAAIAREAGLKESTAKRHLKELMTAKLVKHAVDYKLTTAGRKVAARKALAVSVETVADGTSMPLTVEGIFKHQIYKVISVLYVVLNVHSRYRPWVTENDLKSAIWPPTFFFQ